MFTLSEDKSAYGTLKGLVEALKKDLADAEYKRAQLGNSLRSHDAYKLSGEIGAYNLTISLIMSTDVWRKGQQEEATPKPTHYHIATPEGDVYSCGEPEYVRTWLMKRGVTTCDAFGLLAQGYNVMHCQRDICLNAGKWITEATHERPTTTRTNG
jgi:hypothetical protein